MSKRSSKVILREAIFAAIALVCALGVSGEPALAQGTGKAGDIRVVMKPSDVARQKGSQIVKTDAEKGMTLYYNDVLETGVGGRLRARLDDGSIIALGSQTKLKVIEHNRQTEQTTFQLEAGKVRAQVVKQTQPNAHFDIKSNTAVAGVLGTDEVVDAFSPIATLVFCFDGRVTVRNSDPTVPGNVILTPGQVTLVQQGQAPSQPRTASADEVNGALETSGGAAPQAVADVGTGFATVGQEMLLSAADSFSGLGTITSFQWQIARSSDNLGVYNQTVTVPTVQVDTTTYTPGNYKGTLTVTNSNNQTGTSNFGFVVLPSDIATASPQQVVQELQQAYETLQPSEFMKLFDPVKYVGYAALRDSIENSFRNISQIRVFVRTASGQVYPESKMAIYQVDFEIQFSTKANPNQLFVTREQATLRMESGSNWLISDVPQGSLGSSGLSGIPGTNNPGDVNQSGTQLGVGGGSNIHIGLSGGESVIKIIAGGSGQTFSIENTSNATVTVTVALPPGITISGVGVQGNTVTIPAGGTVQVTFTAAAGVPEGTIQVQTTVTSGSSNQPGPELPVTVFKVTLSVPVAGSSAANPAAVLLGIGGQATVQATSQTGVGQSVSLSASGGQVTAAFSPNPVVLAAGGVSSTVTLTAAANAAPGADQVAIQGTTLGVPASTTLFINRIAPFTFTRTSAASVSLTPGGNAPVTFNVTFNAPFAGPVLITAPAASGGVSFSPPTLTVASSGTANFTVTGTAETPSALNFNFTAAAGAFSQTQPVSVNVAQAIQFTLSGGTTSLQPGQTGQVTVQVGFVSGTPQAVSVAAVPGSINSALISVSGGGTVPNASGSVSFSITVASNAPPGSTSFSITGTAGGTVQTASIGVTILGDFTLSGPPAVSVLQSASTTASISVVGSNGFNAPVNLTATSNNAGVTVTGPSSASVGLPAVLNISASPTASGPTTITVTGTSGTATHSITIAVSVGAFTLATTAIQPVPLFIGGTANVPVTVTAVTAFSGDVTLTATATGGVTVSSVATVPGGNGSRTFTLGTSASAVAGTASVTITGTSGGLTNTLQVSVLLTAPFTLTSSVTQPLQLFIGGTASLPVTVTGAQGFSSDVNLVASPGVGVTADTVLPVSGGSGIRTFTLGSTTDAAAGTISVTITATSGTFSATLQISVQLIDGFTLATDPTVLFLGNPSSFVVHIKRSPNFQGSVTVQIGTLPNGIFSVDNTSITAPGGTDNVVFIVTAGADPALSGQTVNFSISAAAEPSAASAGVVRRAAGRVARALSITAPAVLQAPFSMAASGGGNLGSVQAGNTVNGSVAVGFLGNPPFTGTVQVTPSSAAGVTVSGGGSLTSTGSVPISATAGGATGTFTFQVAGKAGNFSLIVSFSVIVSVPPPPPPPPPPASLGTLLIESGNLQSGTVGQPLFLAAQVLNTSNQPVPNVPVTFTVTAGGGTLTGGLVQVTILTDTSGGAFVTLTLGPAAGTNTVTASATGYSGSPVTFTETGVLPPTQIALVSGNNQSATAGQLLPLPLVVVVTNANQQPVQNVAVTFAVTGGGGTFPGSLTQLVVNTASNGQASVSLTLGAVGGPNTVTASVPNLAGSPVTFSETAIPLNVPTILVTPTAPVQVNANIPVALQVQVVPPGPAFNSVVAVSVPDGAQMQYDPICGAPAGFVSYTGVAGTPSPTHALTINVGPPYTAVRFCMSAGQASASVTPAADSISITGTVAAVVVATTPYSFQIGLPGLSATAASSFNIPFGGSVLANVSVTAANGFNLPLTVFIAAQGSTLVGGKPSGQITPLGVNSADCGPTTSGKVVTPGNSTTCTISNISSASVGSTSPTPLEVFATFGPGSAAIFPFQVCVLDSTASNLTCGGTVPAPPGSFSLLVTPSTTQQVNANIPVTIQVQVIPTGSFISPVSIKVPDGAQLQYDPVCGAPNGTATYNGVAGSPSGTNALTFTISTPYPTVSFCMSAGQAGRLPTVGADSTTISATIVMVSPPPSTTSVHSFQIGMPVVPIPTPATGSTFDIPDGASGTANVTVQFTGGFNPPGGVTVFLAGIGSTISGGKPSVALPTGITSSDCGPTTSGKVLSATGTVTCTITDAFTTTTPTPLSLEAFVSFGPGSAFATQFQICALPRGTLLGTQACGAGILRVGAQLLRVADGRTTDGPPLRFGEVRAGSGLPILSIAPSAIQVSPLLPKEGDRVVFRARVENRGEADARGVHVALVVNRQTVAIQDVDIAANSSAVAEFEWQAAYQPRLSVSIAVDPDGEIAQEGNLLRIAAVRNFSVEPTLPALARQGRSLVVVTNGDCGGFRFASGTQSFCGGSSDVELNPTISAAGQLVVQAMSLNGGIVDLGPGPTTGVLEAPQGGYPSRAVLEGGHLYAVESNGKFALMYIGRMESDVDPRLARLPGGAAPAPQINSGSLPNLGADPLGAMLDRAKITVEMQWSYLENGSRRFQYGFSPSRSAQPGATVYRQPRAPSAPAKQ